MQIETENVNEKISNTIKQEHGGTGALNFYIYSFGVLTQEQISSMICLVHKKQSPKSERRQQIKPANC